MTIQTAYFLEVQILERFMVMLSPLFLKPLSNKFRIYTDLTSINICTDLTSINISKTNIIIVVDNTITIAAEE